MPCNCGKNANATTYVYVSEQGKETRNLTEVQAKAAVIRNGGGTVKPG